MDVSNFCEAIGYNNPMESISTQELVKQLSNNLVTYTRGKIAAPYFIESGIEDVGSVILSRGARFLLDYRTNEIYVVHPVLNVPYGDYMRKLKSFVDDIRKNQLEDYLVGNIESFTGNSDDVFAKKAGVEYDYVFPSSNRRLVIWYKKERSENNDKDRA